METLFSKPQWDILTFIHKDQATKAYGDMADLFCIRLASENLSYHLSVAGFGGASSDNIRDYHHSLTWPSHLWIGHVW